MTETIKKIIEDLPLPACMNNWDELDLLLSHIKPTDTVLEYGSGGSSLAIAQVAAELHTIEHEILWYEKVKPLLPAHAHIYYVPKNQEEKPGDDGTLQEYKDYVDFPKTLGKTFDVVFIDGRARVDAAQVAAGLLNEGGLIFIHDYDHPEEKYRRHEYEPVENFLKKEKGVFAMWMFTKI